jgi:flagellar hook-associated protein 3 FlgL
MRITTSMVQRNILADLNSLSSQLARTQAKASSNKEIMRASDDPYGATKAMGLRANIGETEQFLRNIDDAQGWMDTTESALDSMTIYFHQASDLLQQGATDTADATMRSTLADRVDQIIEGLKESANAAYGGKYVMSGTMTSVPPYQMGPNDAYGGDEAGLDPAIPGIVRELGPGVTMTINSVGKEILGVGNNPASDGKLLGALRDISKHLRDNDGAALRSDMTALPGHLVKVLEVRGRNGAQTQRLESASVRLDQINGALTERLSKTEDVDIAKVMIDFNSQSAAYQSSLRAGANIIQSSLMDFLR